MLFIGQSGMLIPLLVIAASLPRELPFPCKRCKRLHFMCSHSQMV